MGWFLLKVMNFDCFLKKKTGREQKTMKFWRKMTRFVHWFAWHCTRSQFLTNWSCLRKKGEVSSHIQDYFLHILSVLSIFVFFDGCPLTDSRFTMLHRVLLMLVNLLELSDIGLYLFDTLEGDLFKLEIIRRVYLSLKIVKKNENQIVKHRTKNK